MKKKEVQYLKQAIILFRLIYNLPYRRMFNSITWTDDSKLLKKSSLTVRQPRREPHHVIRLI